MLAVWQLLKNHRDLRFALSADLVSLTGDWVLRIGLVYRVYVLTGSTVSTALMLLASFTPQVLLGPIAGVFADRWDRKRTMVVTNFLMAVGLLPLLTVHGKADAWVIYAVLFWEGVVQQFFAPAEQAYLPRLVPEDSLAATYALNSQNQNLARLAGSALGGILAALGAITTIALVDAGSFLVSAGFIACLKTSAQTRFPASGERQTAARRQLAAVRTELVDGLRLAWQNTTLRALMLFVLVTSTGEGIMSTLFAPFVRQVLHGSSQTYGAVAALQAVGGIAGGLLAASVAHRVSPSRLFILGAISFGLIDLAIFLYPLGYVAVWPAAVGMVIVGIPGAFTVAGLFTLFQQKTEDSHRGRIFGTLGAVEGVSVLIGTIGAGVLGEILGIVPVLAFQGASYLAAGLALLLWWRSAESSHSPGQEAARRDAGGSAMKTPEPQDASPGRQGE